MKNQIFDGKSLSVVLGVETAGGDPVIIGDMVGVAVSGGSVGDSVEVMLEGVYQLPKATGSGSGIAQGKKVYWDGGADAITATAGSLKAIGYTHRVCADNDTTVWVRLVQ